MRTEFVIPPRIVYIAYLDNEIDFYGSIMVSISANGHRVEFPFRYIPGGGVTLVHNVDFNVPGVYRVDLVYDDNRLPNVFFFVQVIGLHLADELTPLQFRNFFCSDCWSVFEVP